MSTSVDKSLFLGPRRITFVFISYLTVLVNMKQKNTGSERARTRHADHMIPCQHPTWLTRTARDVWALYWTESHRDFITAIQKSQRSFWRMSSTPRRRRTSSARCMIRWDRSSRYRYTHSLYIRVLHYNGDVDWYFCIKIQTETFHREV